MPIPITGLPSLYYPRCAVLLDLWLEDQVPGSPGAPLSPPIYCVPLDAEVVRNDARHADTCQLVLDYKDFPFDPRLLKAGQVSVHMEDAPTAETPVIPTPLNLRFIGLIDAPESDQSESSQQVTITCRDYTGVFLDYKWGQGPVPAPIPATLTLQAAIEFVRVKVAPLILPAIFPDPTTLPAANTVLSTVLGGKKQFITDQKADDAWTVLTKLTALFGLVPVFNLDQLEIRPAAFPLPNPATFLFGENIEKLRFKKDFRNHQTKPVKIVSWDPAKGVPLEAFYPPTGDPRSLRNRPHPSKSGKTVPKTTVEYQQRNIVGSWTPADLLLIAKRVYDESKADDLMGVLETKEMYGLDSPTSLLGLSNGDTIQVLFDPLFQQVISKMTAAEAVAYLSDFTRPNALAPDVAAAVVSAWTSNANSPLGTSFYVKTATHKWSRDSGYSLKVEFVNFILG